ncbi:MAG TPA: STAS domain-containing protein [Thermoanaerobaculia bacterium]|nr:STAS domain-containing protein [Thermoanaerobaculia bacterium]
MALNVETVGPVRVVTLEGKLVTEAAQDLKNEFEAFVAATPGPTLLDMSGVRYMSSYLVGVLVALRTRLSERGFDLHVAGLDSKHLLVLKVSALDQLFRCHATRSEGIAALLGGPEPRAV